MVDSRKRRIRRSREEWQRLLDEQESSGQTQAAFCAARGIKTTSLRYWKRRLRGESEPEPWVEMGTLTGKQTSGWDIELDLGEGICLRLRRC